MRADHLCVPPKARGIADGDRIEVLNDVGRFVTHAKVSKAAQPGMNDRDTRVEIRRI